MSTPTGLWPVKQEDMVQLAAEKEMTVVLLTRGDDEDAADQAFAFSSLMHKEFRKMANVVRNQVTGNYYMADLTKPALARLQFTATW